MKTFKILIAVLALMIISCSGDDTASGGDESADVYIAGGVSNGENMVVTLWKNGVPTSITNGNFTAYGNDVEVFGGDVYVAGFERNEENTFVAKLWKNGIPTNLSDPFEPGDAYALCMTISENEDVYVGGYQYTNKAVAKYWKNGEQEVVLTNGANDAFVKDIKVSGNDVHVVGSEQSTGARYWKNGTLIALTQETNSSADRIFLAGQDIYIAGYENVQGKYVAKYWKNNVPVVLSDGTMDEYATDIVVVGNDVYVSGRQYDSNTQKNALKYWKNGEPVFLSQDADYSLPTAMAIRGNDVHVTGYQRNTGGQMIAKYWINGVKTDLSSSPSEANGMAVVRR